MPIKVSNGTETYDVDESRLSEAQRDGFVPTIRVTNGEITHEVHPSNLKLAEQDGFKPLEEKPTKLDSAARGFTQGATFGFADEISGATESLFSDKSYSQARDESRANFKKAEQTNPGYYTAGEVGGGIAISAIPLGSAGNLYRAVQAGARLGALSAVGNSEAQDLKTGIRDVAVGATLGAAGGGLAKGVEKGFQAAKGLPAKLIQKQTPAGTGSLESGAMQIADQDPNAFKEVATSIKNRVKSYFNPEVDPKFDEFVDIAKRNGIDPNILPESVKFGPDSSASRAARNLAEGRFGEETLKRFNESLGQVREAYNKKILNYSKGLPVDEVSAGKILRDSYDEGVSKFFDQMDFTHNTIIDQAPGLTLTPQSLQKIESSLNGVEKFAKGRMSRGVTETQRKQGQQLLNAVDAIRARNGSYKQTVEALRDIGEAAFQSKNSLADVPVDVKKMRKIYNDLNDGLIDTVRSNLGSDIADSLVANNKAMSEFFGDQSLISRVMGDKSIAPEQAFQSLILRGDSQELQALKKILPKEKWDYLKGAALENLAKRDPEGDFTFKQLFSSMRSKKNSLASIFEPEELADHLGIVRLGDRYGSPVLSSSGTGASLSFNDLTKAVTNPTVDAFAIRNANKAASKAAQTTQSQPQKVIDVPQWRKDSPSKAAGVLLASASNENTKGPEKWTRVGTENLKRSGISQDQINALLKSKKGKDLIYQASDLKPGSKGMERILLQIKSSSLQGGE